MTYLEAIQKGFPGVQCYSQGTDDSYESIVWEGGSPLPSKATLDEWIAANPNFTNSSKRITTLAFRNRFTQMEKVATELASIHNAESSAPVQQFAAAIRSILRDIDNATYIDLNRVDTRQGVMLLEQHGIIGAGRSLEILDNPIEEFERPLTVGLFP